MISFWLGGLGLNVRLMLRFLGSVFLSLNPVFLLLFLKVLCASNPLSTCSKFVITKAGASRRMFVNALNRLTAARYYLLRNLFKIPVNIWILLDCKSRGCDSLRSLFITLQLHRFHHFCRHDLKRPCCYNGQLAPNYILSDMVISHLR